MNGTDLLFSFSRDANAEQLFSSWDLAAMTEI